MIFHLVLVWQFLHDCSTSAPCLPCCKIHQVCRSGSDAKRKLWEMWQLLITETEHDRVPTHSQGNTGSKKNKKSVQLRPTQNQSAAGWLLAASVEAAAVRTLKKQGRQRSGGGGWCMGERGFVQMEHFEVPGIIIMRSHSGVWTSVRPPHVTPLARLRRVITAGGGGGGGVRFRTVFKCAHVRWRI